MFLASSHERAGLKRGICRLWKNRKDASLPTMYYDCLFSLPRLNRGPARQTVPSQKEHLVWQEGPSLTWAPSSVSPWSFSENLGQHVPGEMSWVHQNSCLLVRQIYLRSALRGMKLWIIGWVFLQQITLAKSKICPNFFLSWKGHCWLWQGFLYFKCDIFGWTLWS